MGRVPEEPFHTRTDTPSLPPTADTEAPAGATPTRLRPLTTGGASIYEEARRRSRGFLHPAWRPAALCLAPFLQGPLPPEAHPGVCQASQAAPRPAPPRSGVGSGRWGQRLACPLGDLFCRGRALRGTDGPAGPLAGGAGQRCGGPFIGHLGGQCKSSNLPWSPQPCRVSPAPQRPPRGTRAPQARGKVRAAPPPWKACGVRQARTRMAKQHAVSLPRLKLPLAVRVSRVFGLLGSRSARDAFPQAATLLLACAARESSPTGCTRRALTPWRSWSARERAERASHHVHAHATAAHAALSRARSAALGRRSVGGRASVWRAQRARRTAAARRARERRLDVCAEEAFVWGAGGWACKHR